MGKLNTFEIIFSNFQGVYYAGQNVQGHLIIELTDDMSMRGIHLKFIGRGYVHWTESSGSGDNETTETYSASEEYFKQDVLLYGNWSHQGRDTTKLPRGRHTFPFCFMLPPSLPSSFEGSDGHVRYYVKGNIDRPWKFDHTCKQPFTIVSILDLNTDPNAMMPVQGHNEKMICCLCCASGPITAEFRLERRGYVPGEAVHLFANIRNNSNRVMDKSYVDLRMATTFHATSKSRTSSKVVGQMTEGPIGEGQSFSWEGQQFVLPPLPPSYLIGCSIIDIRYILLLSVDPSGPAVDLEVPLEIIIGTIPLRQVVEQFPPRAPALPPPQAGYGPPPGTMYPPPEGASAPYPPAEPTAPTMPPSSIPNMPPPSYNESVFGKVNVKDDEDNDHTRGSLDYAPVYTYYDWGHHPTTMSGDGKH